MISDASLYKNFLVHPVPSFYEVLLAQPVLATRRTLFFLFLFNADMATLLAEHLPSTTSASADFTKAGGAVCVSCGDDVVWCVVCTVLVQYSSRT